MPSAFIAALAYIKQAAAMTNAQLGYLEGDIAMRLPMHRKRLLMVSMPNSSRLMFSKLVQEPASI